MLISFIYQPNVYFENLIFIEFFKTETSTLNQRKFVLCFVQPTISKNPITDGSGVYDTQSTNIST